MKKSPYTLHEMTSLILTVFLALFCAQILPSFHQPGIYLNILKQSSFTGMVAIGLLFVFIIGEIDLSIGAQFALYGMLSAYLINSLHLPALLAATITILLAAIVGAFFGFCIHRIRGKTLLLSIAASVIMQGLTYVFGKGRPIFGIGESFESFSSHMIWGISTPVFFMIGMGLFAAFILYRSYWGKYMVATGIDSCAAERSGVPLLSSRILAFSLCSVFSAISAVLYLGRIGSASISAGNGITMDSLTAAALAGVGFSGGHGKIFPVLMGTIFLGALSAVFIAVNIAPYYQTIIKGSILFFALMKQDAEPR